MTRVLLRHRPDEQHIPVAAKPPVRPTGVDAAPLGCVPGTSRRVLDELRADLDPRPCNPTAIRRAFDSGTWVPSSVALRKVPLIADLDDNVTAILTQATAAPFVRHEAALRMALAPIAAMLDQAVSL